MFNLVLILHCKPRETHHVDQIEKRVFWCAIPRQGEHWHDGGDLYTVARVNHCPDDSLPGIDIHFENEEPDTLLELLSNADSGWVCLK